MPLPPHWAVVVPSHQPLGVSQQEQVWGEPQPAPHPKLQPPWGQIPQQPQHRLASAQVPPPQVQERRSPPQPPCAWPAWLRSCSQSQAPPAVPSHAVWNMHSMQSWKPRRPQPRSARTPNPSLAFHSDQSFADSSCLPSCPTSWNPSRPQPPCRRRHSAPVTPSTVVPERRVVRPSQNCAIPP